MANFSSILTCANNSLAPIASPSFTGNVGIGTTTPGMALQVNGTSAWTVVSDARLKMNVETISDGLSLVKRLRGVRFQWRPADERQPEVGSALTLPADGKHFGFIAQEIAAVVPEAVVVPERESIEPYGLKEADLIPILVEAVKEQQAEIEQLRATVAALKSAR
jgi:hypothetical protein